jgi:hypothetical protein
MLGVYSNSRLRTSSGAQIITLHIHILPNFDACLRARLPVRLPWESLDPELRLRLQDLSFELLLARALRQAVDKALCNLSSILWFWMSCKRVCL